MKSLIRQVLTLFLLFIIGETGNCAVKSVVIGKFLYTETGENTCCASFYIEPDNLDDRWNNQCKPALTNVEFKTSGYKVLSHVEIDGKDYTVTSIDYMGYRRNTPLGDINYPLILPNTIERICQDCFFSTDWQPFELPSSIRVIETNAFGMCSGIPLNIPEGVDSIGTTINWYNPTPVTLPSTLKKVGHRAIWFSEDKAELVCYAKIPPEVAAESGQKIVFAREGYNARGENLKRCDKLYVPEESVEIYKNTRGWNDAKEILPIPHTGVEVSGGSNHVSFEVGDGTITAMNAAQPVEVYTNDGRCVAVGTDGTVSGINAGLYIVRCGATVSKVYVR